MCQVGYGLFLCVCDWGLNSELHTCKAGTLLLEPQLQSIFALVILEMGSHELFAQTNLEQQPPYLSFPSS
jgi:hypothetical protein